MLSWSRHRAGSSPATASTYGCGSMRRPRRMFRRLRRRRSIRSRGADTVVVEQRLDVARSRRLARIPPAGDNPVRCRARLRRRTTSVELAGGGGFLGGGILVFGRRARGEGFTTGLLHDRWEVHREGRLVWGDALHVDGDVAAVMANPACFGNAAACATLLLASPHGEPRGLLDGARAVLARSPVRAGATVVNGLLVARWLGDDAWALRRCLRRSRLPFARRRDGNAAAPAAPMARLMLG